MAEDCKGFDALFARNVPHILDKIFLSLDLDSFMRCQEVNNTWNQSLTSEAIKTKAKIVFQEEISKELLNAIVCDLINCEGEQCQGDNPDKVKRLLSTGLVDVNSMISDEYGNEVTPLGLSVYTHGQKVLVRALLEGGADPNIEDKYKCTPLYEAVKKGYREVVNMLLDCL